MSRLFGEGSTDRLTFGQRPVGGDGANPADSRERTDPERGTSKCRTCLVCLKSRKKSSASERPVEDWLSTASDCVSGPLCHQFCLLIHKHSRTTCSIALHHLVVS